MPHNYCDDSSNDNNSDTTSLNPNGSISYAGLKTKKRTHLSNRFDKSVFQQNKLDDTIRSGSDCSLNSDNIDTTPLKPDDSISCAELPYKKSTHLSENTGKIVVKRCETSLCLNSNTCHSPFLPNGCDFFGQATSRIPTPICKTYARAPKTEHSHYGFENNGPTYEETLYSRQSKYFEAAFGTNMTGQPTGDDLWMHRSYHNLQPHHSSSNEISPSARRPGHYASLSGKPSIRMSPSARRPGHYAPLS